ncbi:FAD-binding oxidoreductase [Saccharopolyspora taberi]|uniref:FAD-binding oxidoreductase n=1 Tax=Saccharopolyspora taberi TaxID=60895 RepID=A0ABN3VJR2_9PSEU
MAAIPTEAQRAKVVDALRQDLEPALHGSVLLPSDDAYDAERLGFNRTVDLRPEAAIAVGSAADVVRTVRFAGEHGLPVAVQGTGHGVVLPGNDALLISTRAMGGVRIDPDARTARIEAGVLWGKVVQDAATYGLAPLNGSSPTVGVMGYVLGGGIGPLGSSFGYAADHVRSLDVVTADGRLREVTAQSDPELFWALRGGKGNFGVVTSVEVDLFPLSTVYGGGLFMPGESLPELLRTWRDWAEDVPANMQTAIAVVRFPDLDVVPEPIRGKLVGHVRVTYRGSAEEGERLVRPLRQVAEPLMDTVTNMPYTEIGSVNLDPMEPGPFYERSGRLGSFDDAAIGALLEVAGPDADFPVTVVEIRRIAGALAVEPEQPNAVPYRRPGYTLFVAAPGEGDQVGTVRAAQQKVLDVLAPWRVGGPFVSFLTAEEGEADQVRGAYEPASYERLVRVKNEHDPDNVFRVNHNIAPDGRAD